MNMDSDTNGITSVRSQNGVGHGPSSSPHTIVAAAAPSTTTISTIVLNSKPIQLVIAILQVR